MRKLTKQQERRQMLRLMERREKQTPEHKSPDWMHRFWQQVSR